MDSAVLVAVITAAAALTGTAVNVVWTGKAQRRAQTDLEQVRHQLSREARADEKRAQDRAEFVRYREPLLSAAFELGERIDNILHRGFLAYLEAGERRRRLALLSTLYRFARYFGQLEIIRANIDYLRFERADSTRATAELLAKIGRTLASDRFDAPGADGPRFMLWREEQSAIGDVARTPGSPTACVSFASFVEEYDERYAPWLTSFATDLETADAVDSQRLGRLQCLLANLVRHLDEDGRYLHSGAEGADAEPLWIARATTDNTAG